MTSSNNKRCEITNAKMKMSDLLSDYNILIALLPRLGINLGFGEMTIAQVCEADGVSLPLFLLVCNAYVQKDYTPDWSELQQCPLSDIITYLKASHEDYLEYQLPHIEKHLHEIVQNWSSKYKASITNFFEEYKKEVKHHFNHEEKELFPYAQNLIQHTSTRKKSYKFGVSDKQHNNIEEKLHDFTNLLIKYIPAEVATRERVDMLKDIYTLSEDIMKHDSIEDTILIPYIKYLETHENE